MFALTEYFKCFKTQTFLQPNHKSAAARRSIVTSHQHTKIKVPFTR